MIESYDINDYLKDDKELQKAVIRELFKEISTQQDKIDAYQISENEANEIITELKAYKDVNEDFKTAWEELKAENEQLEKEKKINLQRANALNRELNHLQTCLQEIKAIAEENKDTAQYGGICKSILMIITKAEEE